MPLRGKHWLRVIALSAAIVPVALASPVQRFPLSDVRLLDGPFKDAQETDRTYMLAHDVDRLLAPFRREAGLPEKAPPYGDWESSGLDGHTAGHYLSALASMYASTGDAEMKRRMDYMVAQLAECQKTNADGYVGGVPKGRQLWTEIAAGKIDVTPFGLNGRWVPWYNMHKLLAGLRDAYLVGHNEQAKEVLIGLARWCNALLGHLTDQQVQHMLAAEQGGMDEVLAEVSVITGDQTYLQIARRFCDDALLRPMAAHQDVLTGRHANTQIPKVIGFERIAALGGRDANELHDAALFFWDNVTRERSVAIGGNSVNEHFNDPANYRPMIEERAGPETCNTYNMLRLSEALFSANPLPQYMDYCERALFNHILSSEDIAHGGFVYYTPMRPRQYRVYSQAGKEFWCCVGTGLENHAKYGEFIYAHGSDNQSLYVNLFIASELHWPEQGLTLRQDTTLPDTPSTHLHLSLTKPIKLAVLLRHPDWVSSGQMRVTVNGEDQPIANVASSYETISRQWHDGDVIDIQLPMHMTAERLPDKSNYVAFRYGPVVLAAATGTQDMPDVFATDGWSNQVGKGALEPLATAPTLVSDDLDHLPQKLAPVPGRPLTFAFTDGIRPAQTAPLILEPFFRIQEARYEIYWPIATPQDYQAEQERLAAEERRKLELDRITIDRVAPGEQQSEVEHNFHGDNSSQGNFHGRSWRDARGWFSYELKSSPAPSDLLVTYYGADVGRTFDVLADNKPLATVSLNGERGDSFFEVRYPLASTTGKSVTIKFVAHEGSVAGGIFDLRIVRRNDAAAPADRP